MTPNNISPQLLDKYLKGECSETEKALVEEWYASLKGQPDFLDTLDENTQADIKSQTFERITGSIFIPEEKQRTFIPWRLLAGIAAAVILIAGFYFNNTLRQTEPISIVRQIEEKPQSDVIHFINTEPRIVMHLLPDSSVVWMHAEASISYPKVFDNDKRIVSFSGEGFFDITKDKTRPFSIQSGEMVIKVLGTSFNVKAPAKKNEFSISVVTGSVEVTAPDMEQKAQLVVLKPQQQVVFESLTKKLVINKIIPQPRREIYEPITVVFNETPLNEALDQLRRKFDVDIQLSNKAMARCLINADFEQQSLPQILEMLCETLEAEYTIEGKIVTLTGTPCD